MDRITILNTSNKEIGLSARKNTMGVEFELVNSFIDYFCDYFMSVYKTKNLAVFVEPQLISGYPDIVLAVYDPAIVDYWSKERKKLTTNDLKLLSYLLQATPCDGREIVSCLHMTECSVITSLENLFDAHLINRTNRKWRVSYKSRVYSIKKLIAVEAKVGDTNSLLEQSFINTWFSSQSFGLTASATLRQSTLIKFSQYGIGMYCKAKGFKKVLDARKQTGPLSFAALQFNEWIGNYLSVN